MAGIGKNIKEIGAQKKDKTATEKVQLISQLDKNDKNVAYPNIDWMLTKKQIPNFL